MNNLLDKNFFLRLMSAIILGGIVTFCLIQGNFFFSLLVLILTIISYLEWFTIASNNLSNQEFSKYKSYIMFWGVGGLLLIVPASASLLYLRYITGLTSLVFLILLIVGTDIGAYIFGKLIGGPKLASSISPGKTISGSICGILVAVSIAIAMKLLLYVEYDYYKLIIIAVVISITSQIGDLIESGFKRHFGVKDSGSLLPGHGGFLDRIDGFLIAAPVFMILNLVGWI